MENITISDSMEWIDNLIQFYYHFFQKKYIYIYIYILTFITIK